MALLEVNFMSKSLMRKVPIMVVLPVDKLNFSITSEIVDNGNNPFKTLYLLHGGFGNYTSWVSETRIQRLAEGKNLAVVMPSGDNSFYLDQPETGNFYGEFIGKELVDITRKMFPLSKRREDTFIAGLSMGGYGAIRNGLKYHETFGYVAGLSSALDLEQLQTLGESYPEIAFVKNWFGDSKEALLSDKNPKVLVKDIKEQMKKDPSIHFPKMYMACGTEDDLLRTNREFKDFLVENNVDLTYEEGPGAHTWKFWDTYIEKVLNWLPMKN
ncbi:acetyl esterase [Petrotoga sp. HWH.PT.55.6.1]|uniref:alpha/beta hydrolase n=1 Tax=unclassified Petrotoga TaxID=2620614 RepID=UPI000CA05CD2|nr:MULTISPECIES: alpha/beta hydrolase family protein [unclassified Petrotoga]PNR94032.1 acetyl esterase [Petrotoga sp. HWHPT.55.6.3]RPD35423.1 acetyl esterase [Petrotoga sp. HWH.PT.55.6.1]